MCANFIGVIFDGLMRTSEVAERLGVSVPTVTRWAKAGRLTSVDRVPGATGSYLFREDEVEKLANELAPAT